MEHSRKVVVMPIEMETSRTTRGKQEGGKRNVNPPRKRLVKIILKLAKIKAYDEAGRILGSNGQYMDNTDIDILLAYAMTPGRILSGEMDFVRLLREANVEPELIINDNLRSKLSNFNMQSTQTPDDDDTDIDDSEDFGGPPSTPPNMQVDTQQQPPSPSLPPTPAKVVAQKRAHDYSSDIEEGISASKSRKTAQTGTGKRWIVPT
jgi:hypothetical protein